MVLDRAKLKKLLKEKGVKNLDDFNAFMRDLSKDVVETLLEGELTEFSCLMNKHLGKISINAPVPIFVGIGQCAA